MEEVKKKYILIGIDGKPYQSEEKGLLGGHRKLKLYGKLDCPSALRFVKKGTYQKNRVFFKDENIAQQAGYRPCAVCMPNEYKEWDKSKNMYFIEDLITIILY
jgi:methylphosphotriester-DNA--protein-cysteine methyltransferase